MQLCVLPVLTELFSLFLVLAKMSAGLHCADELYESAWDEAEFVLS